MGDFVKGTQDTLGKLIKKPPLTEKLLKKPPFRFLHDIITEVIRTTSFMKGLYTATEMDSQNVKDKENKVAFLQKAIDVVVIVNKKPLSVKPSKIVAGHEPEKTNELLQEIARAISSKSDSSAAVAKVLGGEPESGKPPKPAKDEDKIRDSSADKRKRDKENRQEKKISSDNRDRSSSRDREKEKGKEKDHKDRNRSKDGERDHHRDRSKDKDREKDRDRSKDREKDRDKERSKDKDRKGRDKDKEREKDHSRDKDKERDRERRERRKRKEEEEAARQQQQNGQEDEEDARPTHGENEDGSSSNRIPRPTSAKGQRRRPMQGSDEVDGGGGQKLDQEKNNLVNGNDSLPPQASRKLARPSSARPAPPRVKKQDAAEDPAMRIGSGKQVTNVIVDNGQNSEDEDDIFVVEDTTPAVEVDALPIGSESLEDDGEHGGLVKKILETKKELEGNKLNDKKDDKPIVMDAARRKERERVQREVEKLSSAIQTLTRSANPLGKIMDYLQEDVDSMQKELEMWKKENQEHALAIKREQGITDTELEPLKAQLTELDQGIDDQLDTIATIKASILRNDDKIAKMMSSVAIS